MAETGAQREEKARKARAAATVKAERKAQAGLSRTLKLRLYPLPAQCDLIRRTIGIQRYVWNRIWLPMVEEAAQARRAHAVAGGETKEAWAEAWRLYPNPTETQLSSARREAAKGGTGTEWIGEAIITPFYRAARNFVAAIKASQGRTMSGVKRKVRAGRVRPRHRRDDPRTGLEWQLQGKMPLGGRALSDVIDLATGTIKVPTLGAVRFADRRRLLKRYLAIVTAEACELTIKRDGAHFYACIAVRGLPAVEAHAKHGSRVGIDMGVANPLATSDGELITHHQQHDITKHLVRLERRKLKAKRQYARKLRAAAKKAGALTETGAFKKGVPIPNSNRMRRLIERQNKIDRQIVGYRADWQRNRAREIATHSEIIVVEALTIRNMTASAAGTAEQPGRNVRAKSKLNRSILARGWGSMRARLKSKAEELGGQVVEVDPAYTSQTCPRCHHTHRDNRKTQADFECVECGFRQHADIVGAMNILERGMSAGAPPAAGRGGLATGSQPSGGDAERAGDPSNKSVREPEVSDKDAEGSRSAKLHNAHNELSDTNARKRPHHPQAPQPKTGGSRDDGD